MSTSSEDFQIFTSLRHDPALLIVPDRPDITTAIIITTTTSTTTTFYNHRHRSPFSNLDLHRDRLLRAAAHFSWPAAVTAKLAGDAGLEYLTASIPEPIATQLRQDHDTGKARKLRICISRDGVLTYDIVETPARPLEGLFATRLPPPAVATAGTSDSHEEDQGELASNKNKNSITAPLDPLLSRTPVVVDSHRTRPSAFTHFKTTSRALYDAARARIPDLPSTSSAAAEILLVSELDGSILEGSFTTPYFWRDGRWVTPPVTDLASDSQHPGAAPGRDERAWSGGHDGVSRRWAIER